MCRSFLVLAAALMLTGLLFARQQARADFPFFISNNSGKNLDLFKCKGTVRRSSFAGETIPANVQNFNFYTVEETIFSPLGEWACGSKLFCIKTACRVVGVNFCLVDRGDNHNVELTVDSSGRISVNMPRSCGATGAAAQTSLAAAGAAGQTSLVEAEAAGFLGHASLPGALDQAGFRLSGTAGDRVTITFAADGAKGGEGEITELSVRSVPGGLLDQRKGAVPIALSVTLPTTGTVEIDAAQVPKTAAGSHRPFRGFYQLTVTSSLAGPIRLAPLASTEP